MNPVFSLAEKWARVNTKFSAPVTRGGRRLLLSAACPAQFIAKARLLRTSIETLLARVHSMSMLECLWLCAALGVPLVFTPWGENSFELPKVVLLRALVLLMVLAALIRFADHRDRLSRRPSLWLLVPALALGLVQIAATVSSIDPRVSLWGSYERQQGLLTLGVYLMVFWVTAANLRTRAQVHRLLQVSVWGSTPVILYGFAQAPGWDPLAWQTNAASPVLSTLGRSNFLGAYLVLVIPLTMGQWLWTRRWKTMLLLLSQVGCLILTQARGAWVGLGVGLLVMMLAWGIAKRNRNLVAAAFGAMALAVGVLALTIFSASPFAAIPELDRLAAISRTTEGSSAARLTIWKTTLPLAAARPWLGYGPETMRAVFAPVFPPQLVYYQGRNVPVDRAHNFWLDTAMSTGVIGVVAWLALLAGLARLAWLGLRNTSDRWEMTIWCALAGAATSHLADLQFGFDLTAGATLFWLILAIAAALPMLNAPKAADHIAAKPDGYGWLPFTVPAGVILLVIGLVCVRPLWADNAYWNSRQVNQSPRQRQVEAERAVELWPIEPKYHEGLADAYIWNGNLSAAEAQLSIADRLGPNDPQVWSALGTLYAYWASLEPGRYLQAEIAFRHAVALAPNIATTHTALGLVLIQQGRLDEGQRELERAAALDATDGIAFHHLADLYQRLGLQQESTWARLQAKRWGGE